MSKYSLHEKFIVPVLQELLTLPSEEITAQGWLYNCVLENIAVVDRHLDKWHIDQKDNTSFCLPRLCALPPSQSPIQLTDLHKVSRQYFCFRVVRSLTVGKSSQHGILHKEKCWNVVLLEHELTKLKDGSLIGWEKQLVKTMSWFLWRNGECPSLYPSFSDQPAPSCPFCSMELPRIEQGGAPTRTEWSSCKSSPVPG